MRIPYTPEGRLKTESPSSAGRMMFPMVMPTVAFCSEVKSWLPGVREERA